MSILIKGLHKPDENHGCPFVDAEYGYCLVDLGVTGNGEKCERMKECPLIELPDHGDLIDRDPAIDELRERIRANGYTNVALVSELNRSIGYLMRLPAVIPEERSEE